MPISVMARTLPRDHGPALAEPNLLQAVEIRKRSCSVNCAKGGTRTPTGFSPQDPESCASANSATFAGPGRNTVRAVGCQDDRRRSAAEPAVIEIDHVACVWTPLALLRCAVRLGLWR